MKVDHITNNGLEAKHTFEEGFNCSQAVFSVFAKDLGLDKIAALKLTTGFAGGIAYRGETCGAVMSAFLMLSLKYGSGIAKDEVAKTRVYQKMASFEEKFLEKYGSIKCKEIVNVEMSDPEARSIAAQNGVFAGTCPHLIQFTAETLSEL